MLNKKKIKTIIISSIIVSIILLIIVFVTVDYFRVKNNKYPIFCLKTNTKNYSNEIWWCLGYKVQRELYTSPTKELNNSDSLLFGSWFKQWETNYYIDKNTEEVIDEIVSIDIITIEDCDNKKQLYYSFDNKNIYTYCIDDIVLSDDKNCISLKEHIETDPNIIDYILVNFTKKLKWDYEDGKTILFGGEDFNILKCHTPYGNKDIYIGDKTMEYFYNFCK